MSEDLTTRLGPVYISERVRNRIEGVIYRAIIKRLGEKDPLSNLEEFVPTFTESIFKTLAHISEEQEMQLDSLIQEMEY